MDHRAGSLHLHGRVLFRPAGGSGPVWWRAAPGPTGSSVSSTRSTASSPSGRGRKAPRRWRARCARIGLTAGIEPEALDACLSDAEKALAMQAVFEAQCRGTWDQLDARPS